MAGRAEHWLDVADRWPDEWVDACGLSDTFVTVTAAQLRAVHAELLAVLDRWRGAGVDDPSARRIQVATLTHPGDTDAEPPAVDRTAG
jgi:hypothetical protein